MKKFNSAQKGFTIIELMIATLVFSVVLLLCSMAIVHVGRMYYKGMITNRTQDTARRVLEDVSSAIQFGAAPQDTDQFKRTETLPFSGYTVETLCLGDIRYNFTRTGYLGQVRHILWRDRWSGHGCPPVDIITLATPTPEGEEMLGSNMRLPNGITVTPSGQMWTVEALVSYGDNDALFESASNYSICKGVNAGGQFCAVSGFSTNVTKRL